MPRVNFDEKNFNHCRCGICPVQYGVGCVRERLEKNHEFKEAAKIPAQNVKVYCSIGESTCDGLKKKRPCLCPTCLVWFGNNLNGLHYCTKGSAEERGK